MKKLITMILVIGLIITGCTNNSNTTQNSSKQASKYINVERIKLEDLLKKINAKEDFVFIMTSGEKCTPCEGLDKFLETFEAEGKTIYKIDIADLTLDQKEELNAKLHDKNYSTKSHFSGVPTTFYFNQEKQVYFTREGFLTSSSYEYFLRGILKMEKKKK